MKKIISIAALLLLTACGNPSLQSGREQARALLEQGIAAYERQDYAAALPLFERSEQGGDMKAPRYIGLMYLNGLGVPKDADKAAAAFQEAAAKGDITGQYWLGYLYEHGLGVAQNWAEALKWYRISAERGDIIAAPAMTALGRLYETGQGVAADRTTALDWYQKAADVGEKDAQAALQRLTSK